MCNASSRPRAITGVRYPRQRQFHAVRPSDEGRPPRRDPRSPTPGRIVLKVQQSCLNPQGQPRTQIILLAGQASLQANPRSRRPSCVERPARGGLPSRVLGGSPLRVRWHRAVRDRGPAEDGRGAKARAHRRRARGTAAPAAPRPHGFHETFYDLRGQVAVDEGESPQSRPGIR